MGNRKQPFGYKMSLGKIVIQESEAKLVQEIFLRYIAGESLNELTEALRQQDIPYDEGRLWNKNMIARILADTSYEYPKSCGLQHNVCNTGSSHGSGSAADGAVLRGRQDCLHPLGKGCGGGRSGVLERTVPGYDRLLSTQCAPDAGFLAVVQQHAGTA